MGGAKVEKGAPGCITVPNYLKGEALVAEKGAQLRGLMGDG